MKQKLPKIIAIVCLGLWSAVAIAQPANDDFCDATPLTINAMFCGGGVTNGDNTNATIETLNNEPGISCGFDNGVASNTVWFTFTPATNTFLDISTNFAASGTNDDTQIVVYEDNGTGAACPNPDLSNLTEVACNDDVDGAIFLSEILCLDVTGGTTYYIQVDGWNGTTGTFCIEVSDAISPVTCDAVPVFVNLAGLPDCAGGGLSAVPLLYCLGDPEIGGAINDDPAAVYIPFAPTGSDGPYDIALSSGTGSFFTGTTGCSNPPNPQDPLVLADLTIGILRVTQADIDNAPGGITSISFTSCGTLCSTLNINWATLPASNDVAALCPPPACDLLGEVSLGSTCTSATEYVVDVTIGAGATGTQFTITNDQNAETLMANGPGTYSFTTPVAQGTQVAVTVQQDVPNSPACNETVSIQIDDCSCFGSIPANNECANAISIPLDDDIAICTQTLVNTTCADQSAEAVSCSATWFDDDVWYSVSIPASFSGEGINIASTFGNGVDPITSNGVAVYDGCGGTELGCYSGGVEELFIPASAFTPPAVLIIRTWSMGNTTADQGTYELCAHVVDCSITSITAGAQSACNPVDQTYTQDVTITYSGNVGSGSLVVNGQNFAITSSPQTVTLTGLPADDANPPVSVTAAFSDLAGCELTVNNLFNAPSTCQPLTCSDAPISFCYGNNLTDVVVAEICPDSPTEIVIAAITDGSVEADFDFLDVYSGLPGSGTGGTQIATDLTGGLGSLAFESQAPGECLIFVMESDADVSCNDGDSDPVIIDCLPTCNNSTCLFPICNINVRPINDFPADLNDLAFNAADPPVTTGLNNEYTVCASFVYNGTNLEGGTFTHIPFAFESGDSDGVVECGTGIVSTELFGPGFIGTDCSTPLTPDAGDPDTYTGLVTGNAYVYCVTYSIINDFTATGSDGATEGTCSLYGIGVAFTPTDCFANAGTFTNNPPLNLICFGETITFSSNGDWANPLGDMANDQTPPAGVFFGLWEDNPPSGNFPTDDTDFAGLVGSEPNNDAGVPELTNTTGGNQVIYVTTIAASDEANGFAGTADCFDVNEQDAVMYTFLDQITGDVSFTCDINGLIDVTISNMGGGIPGLNTVGTYNLNNDLDGVGDPAVAFGGSYTVFGVNPGTSFTIIASDGICTENIDVTTPDLTAPSSTASPVYCIADPVDNITLDVPVGDFGVFDMVLSLDEFSEETGVQLLNDAGDVIFELLPGVFAGFTNCETLLIEMGPFNINDGPFDLVMIDDFGDGMNSNDGTCFGTTCGPGDFSLSDRGSGTAVVPEQLFPGEDSDGDACDALDMADTGTPPNSLVEDRDGDGDVDQVLIIRDLVMTSVNATPTYTGPGVTDLMDGSFDFDPSSAGIGDWQVSVMWVNEFGCNAAFDISLSVEAISQTPGNGIATYAELMNDGQGESPVNPPDFTFTSPSIDNSCVPSPADGTITGLINEDTGNGKPDQIQDDLEKGPCTGALSFNNAPIFYTLRSDPDDDPSDGVNDQLIITIVPIATGSFTQLNVALYGPLTPGSRRLSDPGAMFLGCEQGNGTSPTTLVVDNIPPDQLYFVIVDTDGGTTGRGQFFVSGSGTALPLELLSFEGTALSNSNMLNWTTATESEMDYFEVERSIENADNFEAIGRVEAVGFSWDLSAYEFEDRTPGLNGYYRLKMIEENGSFSYSPVIFIGRKTSSFAVNSIYPNPTKAGVFVEYESDVDQEVVFRLHDVLGRTVGLLEVEAVAGLNKTYVSAIDLSAGIYLLSVDNNDGSSTIVEKIIVE